LIEAGAHGVEAVGRANREQASWTAG